MGEGEEDCYAPDEIHAEITSTDPYLTKKYLRASEGGVGDGTHSYKSSPEGEP
jgi:hypothetical protein